MVIFNFITSRSIKYVTVNFLTQIFTLFLQKYSYNITDFKRMNFSANIVYYDVIILLFLILMNSILFLYIDTIIRKHYVAMS